MLVSLLSRTAEIQLTSEVLHCEQDTDQLVDVRDEEVKCYQICCHQVYSFAEWRSVQTEAARKDNHNHVGKTHPAVAPLPGHCLPRR